MEPFYVEFSDQFRDLLGVVRQQESQFVFDSLWNRVPAPIIYQTYSSIEKDIFGSILRTMPGVTVLPVDPFIYEPEELSRFQAKLAYLLIKSANRVFGQTVDLDDLEIQIQSGGEEALVDIVNSIQNRVIDNSYVFTVENLSRSTDRLYLQRLSQRLNTLNLLATHSGVSVVVGHKLQGNEVDQRIVDAFPSPLKLSLGRYRDWENFMETQMIVNPDVVINTALIQETIHHAGFRPVEVQRVMNFYRYNDLGILRRMPLIQQVDFCFGRQLAADLAYMVHYQINPRQKELLVSLIDGAKSLERISASDSDVFAMENMGLLMLGGDGASVGIAGDFFRRIVAEQHRDPSFYLRIIHNQI